MSADSPRRTLGNASRGMVAVPSIVPPQVVSDRSILDSAIGFINEVTLAHQPHTDPKDTITWARFETSADISDPRYGDDWELEGNVAPPLLLILGYGLGVQVWAIPANGEAVEVLSWRHGIVSALRVLPTPSVSVAIEENGRADEPVDTYAEKRPLIALVDGSPSSGSQPQFCAVNFISLKTGTQVKTIKFKNPVIDVLANRSSIVITFHERIAVFDARTLEDRLSITTCYPSPGINPNPVALGHRWLAYAEHKLIHSKRSGGGCDGEGVASYTATVLNASKSLVKGLRELGEQVAAGLTGTSASGASSKNTSFDSGTGPESKQSGVVTIIDIKNPLRDYSPTSGAPMSSSTSAGTDPMVAHFIAHSEALVAMEFDNTGMLLLTADRRGHDFHVFRIQPNPVGASLAAVHHLYVLHRGDTSAKVQNISFSLDSRWVAVSTLRGTTHVFPITPYGGPMGVRTHTSLHVVNKLSRFHRSAGLSAEGRSNSPISHSESTTFSLSLQPYHNPTLPPYPRPTVVMPLAQLRQPFALGSPPGSATLAGGKSVGSAQGTGSQRQRLSSLSDDSGKPLSVCAIFAKSRSWLLDPPNVTREAPHRMQRKAVDSLFVMAGHGALIQYDLDTKLASSNVAKEKICDDTPIELEVEAKAQWNLGRRKEGSQEIMPPLTLDNWLVKSRNSCMLTDSTRQYDDSDDRGESWLAQVEIVTHAGPHRRLWMGPQFVFKTYNTPSGSNLSHVDIEAVEIGTNSKAAATSAAAKQEHSSPLNMPLTAAGRSSAVPVLIESGSYSSIEQSPKLMDRFRHDHLDSDFAVAHGDTRLKEDLADAMRESPSVSAASKDAGGRGCETTITGCSNDNIAFYDALADHDEDQDQDAQDHESVHNRNASAAALASALPNIYSYDNSSSYESMESLKKPPQASIEKIVNPLGTVTTVTSCLTADVKTDILDEVVSQLAAEDTIIHENCDESLFRPVVAIFCDEKTRLQQVEDERKSQELCQPPENIGNKLVVPVIEKEVDDELNKKEKQKNASKFQRAAQSQDQTKFEELSNLNRKSKNEFPTKGECSIQETQYAKKEGQISRIKEKIPEDTVQVEESTITKSLEAQDSKETKEVIKAKERLNTLSEKSKLKDGKVEEVTKAPPKLDVKFKENANPSTNKYSVELLKEDNCAKKKSKSEGTAKETAMPVSDVAKTKQLKSESKAKESIKASAGVKAKNVSKSKESTPERDLSPKPVVKQMGKTLTCDEFEEDLAMEFQKMTPAKADDKGKPQQILSKKEIKKQQQNLHEDSDKHKEFLIKDIEKEKIKTAVKVSKESKNFEEPTKSKISDGSKIEKNVKKELSLSDTQTKDIITAGEKKKVSEEIKTVSKVEKDGGVLRTTEPLNKSTACKITDSTVDNNCKSHIKESSTGGNELSKTAVDVQINPINKTAIKEEIKRTPTVAKSTKMDVTNPAKKEKSPTIVKTEQLNVKDLADSLIELQDDIGTPKEEPTTPVLETVDIFTAPAIKLSKKNKKKANKSGSSSETEEVVEIIKSDVKSKLKDKVAVPAQKKKLSFSSEETYVDLADSLLERKDVDLKETMFISFSQVEERNKLQERNEAKQAESEKEFLNEKSLKTATASKAATPDKKDSGKKRTENTVDTIPKLKSDSATTSAATEDNEDGESLKEQNSKSVIQFENESDEIKTSNKTKQREDKCLLKNVKQSKVVVSKEKDISNTNTDQTDHTDASSKSLQFKEDTTKSAKHEELKERTENKTEDTAEPSISKVERKSVVKFSLKNKEECNELEKNTGEAMKCKLGERVGLKCDTSKGEDPKKPLENLKKTEEKSEKSGKQTSENIKKNKESSSNSINKTSASEDSNKAKSSVLKQSSIKMSNNDDNEKKKIDCEKKEEKRKDSIKNVKENPDIVSEIKPQTEDTGNDKKCLQDSKISLIAEKDKSNATAVTKSKDSKVDEEKNVGIKNAGEKVKKDDREKPKPLVLSTEIDVIVEQPRRQQNKELEKEIIKQHDNATKVTERKDNLGDEDVALLKPLSLPPMPSRKNENKTSNAEVAKIDSNTKKSNETIAPKEIIKETSKTSKKKPEENVHSPSMTNKSLSASKAEAKNQPIEKARKADDVHKTKLTESLSSDSTKKPVVSLGKTLTSPLPPPPPIPCAWKTLSGAEMIAQNLLKESKPDDTVFPSLGAIAKTPKSGSQKLLPELPTPKDIKEPPSSKKSKATPSLDEFPTLNALEPLPPLPSLEPLELLGESRKDVSLINFESPLAENPAMERKITPPPRGFTDKNLILALCGSLHYENEQRTHATIDKSDASSSNRSSSAMDEPSMADYKSLTENDDPYISLEQSSQDTNTTNTHTTNDKFSSSNNSSGTEEIIIMEEKKMTKKQKRKRQQQLLELQKQKELQNKDNAELDDEELRPLIAMSESQVENIADRMMGSVILPSLLDESFSTRHSAMTKSNALTHSTTTDSEGPMPATTSDDNVFIMPSNTAHTQHKIKTKKMEHKFNLIAAIEAATSSSTSSAEESGVEVGDDSPPMASSALISAMAGLSPPGGASPMLPMPMSPVVVGAQQVAASLGCTVGALKKKTKRRKR